MARKTICSALSAGNNAWEIAARAIARQQQQTSRTFSSSSARNANVANFTPTSSPALDDLLATIRHRIILPAYLPRDQRKTIYDPKQENRLRSDPIIIEIDGEAIKFRHMNPLTGDIPNTRKSVMSAVSAFKTPADFANLRPLLEGVRYANRKIEHDVYAKIARIAGSRGQIFEIIEAARSVRRTGFKLDASEKVNEVMHFVQMKAVDSAWDEAETRQALRWAEIVVELLESDGHKPKRTEGAALNDVPLHRDPQVLAAPLHLAAALVVKHGAGEDIAEKVTKLARDIVRLWPQGKGLLQLHPEAAYADPERMAYLTDSSKFVTMAAPLMHGLELATQVVGPELAKELKIRWDTLTAEVEKARSEVSPTSRAEKVYNKLYKS